MKHDAGLLDATLSEAAGLLRAGRTSALELAQACAGRIEELNPVLRAFLHTRYEAALADARKADEAYALGRDCPILCGIPLAHKDMFYRAGERLTFGAHPDRARCPHITATVKNRLDAHMALDLGGLNMSEYASGPGGVNAHHGRCANPWAIGHLSGGSSSGSAAAVAARMIYGSLGSDTGGSIRIPAALCGVTGLKPGFGRVSRHGTMPRVWSQDCIGPIARSAEDCALIFAAIAGPDGLDPLVIPDAPPFEWPAHPPERPLRIAVLETAERADRDVERCIEQAIADLGSLGHTVGATRWPGMADVSTLAEVVHKAEASAIHDILLRASPQAYDEFVRSRFEDGLMISAVRYLQAQSMRPVMLRNFVEHAMHGFDVAVLPTVGCQAPSAARLHDDSHANRAMLKKLTCFTRPFSYLGLPALTVPCGFGDSGLPVGLQIIGRPFAESLILALGQSYQRATAWHRQYPAAIQSGPPGPQAAAARGNTP